MKILFAITTLGPGGAEKVVADLSAAAAAAGHQVTVLALAPPPENPVIPDSIRACGAEVRFLGLRKSSPLMLAKIRTAVRRIKPDVIHTHLIHPNILFRLACTGMNIPLVNTVHISERRPGKKIFFLLDRLTFSRADVVTAVSDASARFHEKVCGLPPHSIRTVYNGVDPLPRVSAARRAAVERKFGFAGYDKVIGSIGRLDYQKGYDLLLQRAAALSDVIPSGRKFLLIVFGEGPERKNLEKIIRSRRFGNLDIVLGGFQPDAASLTELFDVFVMPSRYEGYGLALAEAMSFGLPVVCSDADSLPELCARYGGFSRTVCMAQDPDGEIFARAIMDAAEHPHGTGIILQTKADMASDYFLIYKECMARHASGGHSA